ncbi:MAG TPA: hypothetical protein VHA11_04945 [Bryobacteraceae bacterium]|nr:hypothetical protein [Bryobacteraceae bacterium]
MKKKRIAEPEQVVSREILDKARRAAHPDKLPRAAKCTVCGAECAANADSSEQLCWVCRRLKISAWHEGEQQMPVQE